MSACSLDTGLKERPAHTYARRLRRRFFFMAVLNGIFAPFIVMYLVVYSFLRYFEVSMLRRVNVIGLLNKSACRSTTNTLPT